MNTTKITGLGHVRLCLAFGSGLGIVSNTATTVTFAGEPSEVYLRALNVHDAIATRQRQGQRHYAFPDDVSTGSGSLKGGDYQVFGAIKRRIKKQVVS